MVLVGDHAAVDGAPQLGLSPAHAPLRVLPADDAELRFVHDDGGLLLQDALDRHKHASRAGVAP